VATQAGCRHSPWFTEHLGPNRPYLRDATLGVNAGRVSTLLLVAGVVGGGLSPRNVLLTGLARAGGRGDHHGGRRAPGHSPGTRPSGESAGRSGGTTATAAGGSGSSCETPSRPSAGRGHCRNGS